MNVKSAMIAVPPGARRPVGEVRPVRAPGDDEKRNAYHAYDSGTVTSIDRDVDVGAQVRWCATIATTT
jgi:hypothetical protein